MMYILSEEEYQNLQDNNSGGVPTEFFRHMVFFQCTECGRLTAMQKSNKDTEKDVATLAQGCPGCGENVMPLKLSPEEIIKQVVGK